MNRFCQLAIFVSILFALMACEPSGKADNKETSSSTEKPAHYVMAISWQPAFCETASRKPECQSQHSGRYDANHFSIHGLWPQPGNKVYCGVSQSEIEMDKNGRWRDLDMQRIAGGIWKELQIMMPGTKSFLHKHEWTKHGTCTGRNVDEYYAQSIRILKAINESPLQTLFADNIGKELRGAEIRAAFDRHFGDRAGDRIRISCKKDENSGRQMIVELTIGLTDPFNNKGDLSASFLAAPKTDPGCPAGIVDPVGFQ